MYDTIICGLTDAQDAARLMPKALWVGRCLPSRLHLVHICEHPLSGYGELSPTGVTEPEIALLDSHWLVRLANDYNIPRQNLHILFGSPPDQLCHLAIEKQADLILLGAHKLSLLESLARSTAERTRNRCHCDILTIFCPRHGPE